MQSLSQQGCGSSIKPLVFVQSILVNSEISGAVMDVVAEISDEVSHGHCDLAAGVSLDGRAIVFRLSDHQREVECEITRETLEECFWLSAGEDSACMQRTFTDDHQRIIAIAERRMRARPDQTIQLTIADFLGRR